MALETTFLISMGWSLSEDSGFMLALDEVPLLRDELALDLEIGWGEKTSLKSSSSSSSSMEEEFFRGKGVLVITTPEVIGSLVRSLRSGPSLMMVKIRKTFEHWLRIPWKSLLSKRSVLQQLLNCSQVVSLRDSWYQSCLLCTTLLNIPSYLPTAKCFILHCALATQFKRAWLCIYHHQSESPSFKKPNFSCTLHLYCCWKVTNASPFSTCLGPRMLQWMDFRYSTYPKCRGGWLLV